MSRRWLGLVGLGLLFAGCLSAPSERTTAGPASSPTQTPPAQSEVPADSPPPASAVAPVPGPVQPEVLEGSVPITVRWILDGDSLEADTPWGNVEVRLLGVNANERDECFGEEAKDALIGRLEKDEAQFWTEVHETYGPDRDEYGRLLGYIWQDGRLINLDQVADGYAVARSAFGHPLEDIFDEAETTAQANAIGLWSPTACGTDATASPALPPGAIVITELNFDAAGRDDENPNGEWIELTNESAEPVDLTGWMIRDESTRHRYEFGAAVSLAPGDRVRLRSGCGTDSFDGDRIELFWCGAFGPVWSNSGDTAIVQDPSGNIVASESYDSIYD